MQNLIQTVMQQWGRKALRQMTNRDALLLTTSAMLAMLLVGCGGDSDVEIVGTEHIISSSYIISSSSSLDPRDVYAADVDGDGDMDVLSASYLEDKIAWYKNDGSGSFTEYDITTLADGANSVYAADVDGDGDMDLLSASYLDDKIAWYENDGNQNFTEHAITTDAKGAVSVFAADLDGDNDMDVLSASIEDDTIAWYENDGHETFTKHVITTDADGARDVYAVDVDGDGDMDVLSASTEDDKIAWYENMGRNDEDKLIFKEHVITTYAAGAISVYAVDVDGDGEMDVLSASYLDDKIAWHENMGRNDEAKLIFKEHVITTAVVGPYSVYAADVDGDGDMDVLSASKYDDTIALYENDGSQNFTEHDITTDADGAYSVYAADMDGDGFMEALSASIDDNKIAWHEIDIA